ncbi:MAG TPA: multidrug efflux SMR transporter [Corynebacteriales bacterium]|nr:multidrug efflux SMR transporter [Mycobacteriales bacterium]
MAWFILVSSAVFEAVWAIAMSLSEGFTRLGPTIVFAIALIISMSGLGWAVKRIPLGTAYTVWTGIGASLAVIYSMASGMEPVTVGKVVFLAGIILCVVGLKMVSPASDNKKSDSAATTAD